MLCSNCGKENPPKNKYCMDCGKPLETSKGKNSKIVTILSVIFGVPLIIYLIYYFCILFGKIDVTYNTKSINILPVILINVAILVFFSIKYHNVCAEVFLVLNIISIIVILFVLAAMVVAGVMLLPLDCLGYTCNSCLSIDGGGTAYNGIFFSESSEGSCADNCFVYIKPFEIYYGF